MEWWIYFANVLGNIQGVCIGVAVITGIVFVVAGIGYLAGESIRKGVPILFGILCFIFSTIASFLPDKDTVYAMIAVKCGEEILQSEPVQNISGKTIDLLDVWLDQKKEELLKKNQDIPE